MAKIAVLGCGMIGSAIARDLATKHQVIVSDRDKKQLAALKDLVQLETKTADLRKEEEVNEIISDVDLVVCAVPGFMGFELLKIVLSAGKNAVDISFFPEKASELDYLAKKNEVFAVVDCGVAPGMDNILLGYHDKHMEINSFTCLVGGLPKLRKWPFSYKAPFSPIDVIEEYTRPARLMEFGQVITKPALSDCERVNFDKAGTLEAFNTDGLRSLLTTMSHIPNMCEKTLRYPGHAEYIQVLASSGFFAEQPIEINGIEVNPLEFTSQVLIDNWKLKKSDPEFTIMRVIIDGEENGKQKRYTYNLYDETDFENNMSSMARTTGFTASAAVNFVLENEAPESGVIAPEQFGALEGSYDFVLAYLAERKVHYRKEEFTLTTEKQK